MTNGLPKPRDNKNYQANVGGNKRCIKNITSARTGCVLCNMYASFCVTAVGVQTNNQRRQRSGPCRHCEVLDKDM